ncbi:MAG: hypothetical protein R3252_00640 [Robiginitalea sp.]|nr:hypothetical protein [Robiginitalea sp.]
MLPRVLTIFLALTLLGACKQETKKEAGTEALPEGSAVEEATPEAQNPMAEVVTTKDFCFASRTPTPEEFGESYNYQFTRLHIDDNGKVTGTLINAPYGTDGSRGAITGVYREDQALVQTTTTYLAEGQLYEEQRDYKIGSDGLATLNAKKEAILTVPAVSCDQYDSYLKEYQQGILKNRVNTTDRTRLKKMEEIAEFGYGAEDLNNLQFMEVEVDLDNNYETREFLVYLMDSMVCGSGGCTLFLIDQDGKTLSSTSVVKLPIFMPTSTMGDVDRKGTWKSLYVWSQGFRELVPENGGYPSNASMAPEVPEDALSNHPEKYMLVLDYLE